jgi:hypothetical protein
VTSLSFLNRVLRFGFNKRKSPRPENDRAILLRKPASPPRDPDKRTADPH